MKAVGIILAGGNSRRMAELTKTRAIAALPVAGSYCGVDFALSNMSNSNVSTVAVITQYSSRSLNEHLSSSKWWDFGRKQGGLYRFSPTITPDNSNWYRGTADSLIQNLDFLKERHEPYVVIASGDGVYKMDFNDMLAYHIESGADITVACKKPSADDDLSRFGILELDEDNRITRWEEKPVGTDGHWINCGIYIIRRRQLINLLENCRNTDSYDLVRDVLIRYISAKKIMAYRYEGYWSNIATIESYYHCNMDFLKPELRKHFFMEYPVIHTKVDDNPPAKFNGEAEVKNSLVAGGSIIDGHVENSVIFKKTYVGNNSVVRNSILLDDVYVGDNVVLENCIVDSRVRIEDGAKYEGSSKKIKVITE